jgi:hypothetical protein
VLGDVPPSGNASAIDHVGMSAMGAALPLIATRPEESSLAIFMQPWPFVLSFILS